MITTDRHPYHNELPNDEHCSLVTSVVEKPSRQHLSDTVEAPVQRQDDEDCFSKAFLLQTFHGKTYIPHSTASFQDLATATKVTLTFTTQQNGKEVTAGRLNDSRDDSSQLTSHVLPSETKETNSRRRQHSPEKRSRAHDAKKTKQSKWNDWSFQVALLASSPENIKLAAEKDVTQLKSVQRRTPQKRVLFSTVMTREHEQILGDHPCCKYGPSISIGWKSRDLEPVAVEEYEQCRNKADEGNEGEDFRLSMDARLQIVRDLGYCHRTILKSLSDIAVIRQRRKQTRQLDELAMGADKMVSKVEGRACAQNHINNEK